MVIVMTVVNEIKYRKMIKVGINFIAPIVLLIYLVTSFMNLSLISAEFGIDAIQYRTATYSSIGITVLLTVLYFLGRVYPKVSLKRRVTIFIISLLVLTDGIIWWDLRIIEIFMEGTGSISVDLTPLFLGIIILLSCNLILKGFNLFSIGKETKL